MKKIIIVLIVIILLGVGWYLGTPLFIDKEVDEAFPVPSNIPTTEELEQMSPEEREQIQAQILEMTSKQPDIEMDEAMPTPISEEESKEIMPEKLLSGIFQDADSFHKSSGEASIYKIESENILRFENFSVTNGPKLVVLLSSHPDPKSKEDIQNSEYIELADLKGNIGNQNYEIPAEVNLDNLKTVVIYCKPFHVIFGTALLK